MKKKCLQPRVIIPGILIAALIIWFWPFRVFSQPAENVSYIKMFNGNTGRLITISDEETIKKLTSNFSGVYLRRRFAFTPSSGFNLMVNVYTMDGEEHHFTINSAKDAKKSFRYYSYWGEYDYDYLQKLFIERAEEIEH